MVTTIPVDLSVLETLERRPDREGLQFVDSFPRLAAFSGSKRGPDAAPMWTGGRRELA
jgi:hypothetical protein